MDTLWLSSHSVRNGGGSIASADRFDDRLYFSIADIWYYSRSHAVILHILTMQMLLYDSDYELGVTVTRGGINPLSISARPSSLSVERLQRPPYLICSRLYYTCLLADM